MSADEAARMDEEYVHCHRCGGDFRGEEGECPPCERELARERAERERSAELLDRFGNDED